MKQITVQIPENKFSMIIELLNELGVKDVHENDLYIPSWQQELINERMKSHDSTKALKFDQFKEHMSAKYGV